MVWSLDCLPGYLRQNAFIAENPPFLVFNNTQSRVFGAGASKTRKHDPLAPLILLPALQPPASRVSYLGLILSLDMMYL